LYQGRKLRLKEGDTESKNQKTGRVVVTGEGKNEDSLWGGEGEGNSNEHWLNQKRWKGQETLSARPNGHRKAKKRRKGGGEKSFFPGRSCTKKQKENCQNKKKASTGTKK